MSTPVPRDAFPVTERWAYLNHAGIAPIPAPALEAIQGCARATAHHGGLAIDEQSAHAEEVRAKAAALLGVPVADVAFVKNTTEGLGFVANGLEWSEGDRVVVPDLEFPTTVYPWLALRDRGVIVDLVSPEGESRTLPVEAFAQAIATGPTPKVVAASWVQYGRGWRVDLPALADVCHSAGALLCVDVIQGLGLIPAQFEAWGVDFAAADAHKWMLGPVGIGLLYVRQSCLDRLRPLEPGWASVAHRGDWDNLELDWEPTARRLEGGSANYLGIYAMGAALDLLGEAGVRKVWAHVDALCDRACEGLAETGARVLSDRSPAGRSGVVTFRVGDLDPGVVVGRLKERGVVGAARGGGVRVSPHGYNSPDEIDRLVVAVEEVRESTG